ncbi:thiamine pyrophosphate-binding protein [Leucobacter sp. cx-328]|uniref:thiamine pyrophosphate-binding protein n=1 Tax=unclassified Leucobacter TaxID=2621730 RepID=UPI00165E37AE|nr:MULTISPECIES: thiamine pyrophosphate-binding protein [unclassified Leucobacter]MBC9943108.1 thiamine pyrophosphate-binding protein [Leucobacter sp. cx-328]
MSSPLQTLTPTLTQTLAHALAQHADRSFGLMGNGNAHLIDHLGKVGVPYTAVRHEAATVAAADAYTRVSGKIAIATTTYGAGFTNALTALAEAAQAHTPMLVVVGDEPSSGPRPWDVNQTMHATAIGVRTFTLGLADVARTVDEAVAYALQAQVPVILAIPYDLVAAPAEATGADHPAAGTAADASLPALDPTAVAPVASSQLDAAALALSQAARPVIIAGRGAHLAGVAPQLDAIADHLGAITSTTALARGLFAGQATDLGVTGGFGQIQAMEVIESADVVLVVGASLNQFTMRFGDLFGAGTRVIRVDAADVPAPKTNSPIDYVLLQGDARDVIAELGARIAATPPTSAPWRDTVTGLEPGGERRHRSSGLDEHPSGVCADGRLDPRAVATRVGELLPADRHVTSDGGHFLGWANMYWPIASPERMIMVGTAYQTIGLGFSTVAGVSAAAPESTTVLTTGDGGGLMALADLETAIRTSASLVVVVWNDGAYGAEVHLYGVMGLDQAPMLIPDANFAGMAAALGATGVVVSSLADLDALRDWTEAGARGTIVLDCRVSQSVVAEYQREIQRVNGLDVE